MMRCRYTMGKDIISQVRAQWTREAMLEEIRYEFQKQELEYDPTIDELSNDELFEEFFVRTGIVDGESYYSIDPVAVGRYAEDYGEFGNILQECYIGNRWVVQLREKIRTYAVTVFDGEKVKSLYEDRDYFMAFHLMDKYIGSYIRSAVNSGEEAPIVTFSNKEELDYD